MTDEQTTKLVQVLGFAMALFGVGKLVIQHLTLAYLGAWYWVMLGLVLVGGICIGWGAGYRSATQHLYRVDRDWYE